MTTSPRLAATSRRQPSRWLTAVFLISTHAGFASAQSAQSVQDSNTAPLLPLARQTATPSRTDTEISPLRYDSVFANYKPYRDEKTTAWRDANDTVAKIGGWRAYAREAQQPDTAPPPAPPNPTPNPTSNPTPTAKPDPHAGRGVSR